jgi:hypothetical protein
MVLSLGPETRPFEVGEQGDAGLIYISLIFSAVSLPSMVMAWRERDI